MSFAIMTDTAANLLSSHLTQREITAVPLEYFLDGTAHTCNAVDEIDGEAFYASLGEKEIKTAQSNPQRYMDVMEPILEKGRDILCITLSTGISGTYTSACIAADQLHEAYPERTVYVIDAKGASLGEGLLVLRACDCRDAGMSLKETAAAIEEMRERMCQVFTVDDLRFLRKGGRISGAVAFVGTLLDFKPLLKGDEDGRIVMTGKVRGKKRAITAMAEKYEALVADAQEQCIGIAYAGHYEDAKKLEELLKKNKPPREILTVCYEPVTGVHVGPGALALFFLGDKDVRKK
ncbi:MAG: DegV family protein [Faecousia sp.]|nr:DegV family protein [Bacillota bacterium]